MKDSKKPNEAKKFLDKQARDRAADEKASHEFPKEAEKWVQSTKRILDRLAVDHADRGNQFLATKIFDPQDRDSIGFQVSYRNRDDYQLWFRLRNGCVITESDCGSSSDQVRVEDADEKWIESQVGTLISGALKAIERSG